VKAEVILVVDDEPGMLRAVERVLAPRHPVLVAGSATEALAHAREAEPDLAILDIRMPDMDGYELSGRLREVCPGIDVIFMTGSVHELDSQHIRAIRERAFYFMQKPFDREVLLTLVDRCLEQRRLFAQNRAHVARLEAELAAARAFQESLLPGTSLELPGLTLAGRALPCDELGGDLYDFVAIGERAALLVADVSGHGVAAAMLTGIVKSAFRASRAEDFDPRAVVDRVSRAMASFDDGCFVTLFAARAGRGVLEYVSAGHTPALLWGAERPLETLGLTGPLVSPAFTGMTWDQERREIASGERLLVFTDGLTEARDEAGNLWGEERLAALAVDSSAVDVALVDEVIAAERAFAAGRPPEDDRTLLTVRWA